MQPLLDPRFLRLTAKFENAFLWLSEQLERSSSDASAAIDRAVELFTEFFDSVDSAAVRSVNRPEFDEAGNLPPILSCSESEVDDWFGVNTHRLSLLNRVHRWIRLGRTICAKRLLIDGSFVTSKDAPGDVDAVLLLPDDFDQQLNDRNQAAVELLICYQTRNPKELFFADNEKDWWDWVEFFGRTRHPDGRRKGLIEVQL